MKQKEAVRCYHCGKIYDLSKDTIREVISCSHCHRSMKLDRKSERRFNIVRYFLVLFISMNVIVLLTLLLKNTLLVMLASFALAMLLTSSTEHLCLRITHSLFGLTYEEYHPEEIERLEKEEDRQREKKKRLKQAQKAEKKLGK